MHRNALLTPEGRQRLCQLIEEGWPVATAAESMRIPRQTAHKCAIIKKPERTA